jgi:hypothetical protein
MPKRIVWVILSWDGVEAVCSSQVEANRIYEEIMVSSLDYREEVRIIECEMDVFRRTVAATLPNDLN